MAGVKNTVTGFNMISIGGNSHNVWAGQTNEEQWMYDIDDLRTAQAAALEVNLSLTGGNDSN